MRKFIKRSITCLLSVTFLFGITACTTDSSSELSLDNARLIFRDKDAWTTPDLFDSGFYFEIQDADEIVEKLQIGRKRSDKNSAQGTERMARAEEWGYSFYNLDGITDGMGRNIHADWRASDRKEAVEKIFVYLENQYKAISESKVYYSMNGHYPFHHYAGEAGFDVLGTEIGENINSYQWRIALNRGAARQYDKPWFVDFSMWNSGTILDYTNGEHWAEGSINGGHSLNLFERAMVMSYMAGASSLVAEGGDKLVIDKSLKITPYGEVCKKIFDFTNKQQAGIPYTPFGLVLDYYHGTYSGIGEKLSFNQFEYNDGDKMTDDLLNLIWDGGISINTKKIENNVMLNNPYGDVFDVILQNASETALNSYPCLILTGAIQFSEEEVQRYIDYVKNGGILVLNSAYKKYFQIWDKNYQNSESQFEFSYGDGSVIVYGNDYSVDNLPTILKELKTRLVPFSISEDVEHLINVTEDSVILTLINNQGITKKLKKKEKISKKEKNINIQCALNENIKGIKELYNNIPLQLDGKNVSLSLRSGDIAVIEYKF